MKTQALKILWLALSLLVVPAAFAAQATPAPAVKTGEKKYIPYRIARGDRLSVAVFGEADLTRGGLKVEATGTIRLTLLEEMRVVGMTIAEAQAAIEGAYRDGRFLRNPQVTVTVEESVPRWVAVSGKINIPGRHEMPADTVWTLKELIIKAGGLQETAAGRRVRITRTMPDGSTLYFEKDVESMLKGKTSSTSTDADFVLEPEDIVYVPEKII